MAKTRRGNTPPPQPPIVVTNPPYAVRAPEKHGKAPGAAAPPYREKEPETVTQPGKSAQHCPTCGAVLPETPE